MKIEYDEPKDERINTGQPMWRESMLSFLALGIGSFSSISIYRIGEDGGFSGWILVLMLLGNTIFLAFLAGLISYITYHWGIRQSIRHLGNAARKVAAGDFTVRVLHQRNDNKYDEMEVLIDDFNKMVEELAANETLKSDFISNVSHEIKTPIAIIRNYAQALQTEELSPEQRQYYVETISESAAKLSDLVGNILRLNKMESQAIVEREQFSLDEQLRCCVLALEEKFEEKNLELDIDLEEEILLFNDASLLEIAWNNLLGNAIKYTPKGGCIGVSARKASDTKAVVVIRDNGIGMKKEVAHHMFEKFYQGDTSHSSQGNGLGLAMVAKVMELCDGQIRVETREGEGTAFTITLDLIGAS